MDIMGYANEIKRFHHEIQKARSECDLCITYSGGYSYEMLPLLYLPDCSCCNSIETEIKEFIDNNTEVENEA